jgi:four helix bundle protein
MEMATIKYFEDLENWQIAREISKEIYKLTIKDSFKKDFSLIDQIRRSSGSIMDNIAEGFERDGSGEFKQFLSISKGSSGECRSQLYRAYDQNYISEIEFNFLRDKLLEENIKIKRFMAYLRKSEFSGTKFKKTNT